MAYDSETIASKDPPPSSWETDEEKSAKSEMAKAGLYLKFIQRSKDEARTWMAEAKEAWREYQAENADGRYRKLNFWVCDNYQRYWADTQIKLAAVYSQTPNPIAQAWFDQDSIAKTACIGLESLAKYLISRCSFDRHMTTSCLEFLHASRATARLYFDAELIARAKRVPLQMVPSVDDQGTNIEIAVTMAGELPPEGSPVLYDEDGNPYYEEDGEEEEVVDPKIYFRPLHFDQVLISPGARCYEDIWYMAYKCTITRKDAVKQFGEVITKLPMPMAPGMQTTSNTASRDAPDMFEYYELWDKRTRMVYFLHEDYHEGFLKEEKDPYELIDFFPSPPFMMTNERWTDMYPVPVYTQTRDYYEQLHLSARRQNRFLKALKGSALYDGSIPELVTMFTELSDGQGVAVANFKDLLDKGGLDSLISFPDYQRLGATYQTIVGGFTSSENQLDTLSGISEIIRGTSDPVTSATAERIKKQSATNRFSLMQREVERFVRDVIEMMCDIALKTFEEYQLKEIMGVSYWDANDQNNWNSALAILRDDKSRKVRLHIETDSLIAINEEDEKNNAMELLDSLGKYWSSIVTLIQQQPLIAPLAIKIAEVTIPKMRYGKRAQDELKQTFAALNEQIQQPPQPPAPDPQMEQIQSNERIAQMQEQFNMQKAQMDFQLNAQKSSTDSQLRQMQLQLDQFVQSAKIRQADGQMALDVRKEQFTEQIEMNKLGIDVQESQALLREKMIQEQRLLQQNVQVPEEKMAIQRQIQALAQMPQPPHQQSPNVTINVGQPQGPPQPTVFSPSPFGSPMLSEPAVGPMISPMQSPILGGGSGLI